MRAADDALASGAAGALDDKMAEALASPVLDARTDDDKSLACAVWRGARGQAGVDGPTERHPSDDAS